MSNGKNLINLLYSFKTAYPELRLLSNEDIKKVFIFSITGDLILTKPQKKFSISGIPSGIYIIRTEDINGCISTDKILKV